MTTLNADDTGFLRGRAAMVSGGASGIGLAIANGLARAGADVAIGSLLASSGSRLLPDQATHMPGADALEAACGCIEAQGVRALGLALDVRNQESIEAFYGAVTDALGAPAILINAAGTDAKHPMVDHPDALWQVAIDTNLGGAYRVIKRCLPGMIDRGWGRIVCLASTAATVGAPAHAAYCASKAGVVGLVRCVALEGAAHGVTCNAISPGIVDTPASRASQRLRDWIDGSPKTLAERHADFRASYPQGRLIEAAEIAALAVFLCRDDALGVTAQNITVSGGSHW